MGRLEQIVDLAPSEENFLDAVLRGLAGPQKSLPCKFFYDAAGSALFDQITALEEYYPTRTELQILRARADEMAAIVGPKAEVIELGAGSVQKVRILLEALDNPAGFVGLDISRDHLIAAMKDLAADLPQVPMSAVVADYTKPINLPQGRQGSKRVGFFPGSTIGNFAPPEAVAFLKVVRDIVGRGGELIIGADLQKAPEILRAAYNDRQGVTAAFNLNLLQRINRELDADIDVSAFSHDAIYDEELGRIEMHLISDRAQTARIGARQFAFSAGERIHTENSHKFTVEGFQALCARAGFVPLKVWTDDRNYFSVHYLQAK